MATATRTPRKSGTVAAFRNGFYTAKDIQELLCCGQTYAYGVIKSLNKELEDKGFLTVRGKVSKKYFHEKFYG